MRYFLLCAWLIFSVGFSQLAKADFVNGSFEQAYTIPSPNTIPYVNIPGWTSTGYLFTAYAPNLVLPPKSLNDIVLGTSSAAPFGITDIVSGAAQSVNDWFLFGATPTPVLLLPENGSQGAMINLRSVNAKQAVSGTSGKPTGWSTFGKQATSLSQRITITTADVSVDGKVHIRFKAAPVLENPAHTAKQQPFYAIQLNNYSTGRYGSNPLYFQWSYAGQPGVPWQTLTAKGSNSGSNATYTYTDWQTFDIAPGNNDIHVGDEIELVVLAAGCSPGGHDGHIYLDNVTTGALGGLLISATGPATTSPGSTITYTYTYTNNSASPVNSVVVTAHMPQSQNSPVPYDTIFSSVGTPSTGTCSYNGLTNLVTCNIGSLAAGAIGTFTMDVIVPDSWPVSYGPINNGNFPIEGTGVNPVLGNLVQTDMTSAPPPANYSTLEVNLDGLKISGDNPSIVSGTNYTGTYSCTNTSVTNSTSATCEISNLPPGLLVTGCAITPSGTWTQPSVIPSGQTVTCTVSGTATSPFSKEYEVLVISDASNNTNSVTNHGTIPFYIYNNPVSIPATINGSSVLSPAAICCGRPVMVYDLPIESDLPATYSILSIKGNIRCEIGSNGSNNFVKVYGRPGTCTIQAEKDDQISAPLTLVAN